MKVLVLNSGSSSIKFKLYDITSDDNKLLISGIADAITLPTSKLTYEINYSNLPSKNPALSPNKVRPTIKKQIIMRFENHESALNKILDTIINESIIKSIDEIDAIGHRVVHGGEKFKKPVIITPDVIRTIEQLSFLAPLHNPPNLLGIKAISKKLPNKPQVAVFDTGFHSTMPNYSYLYPLPYSFYTKHQIRRYGFHGTSHEYVCTKASEILSKPLDTLNLISCHLGNGASITAVENGKSVDTSMGLTPLEGLMMGTRCGDIDPYIPLFLQKLGETPEETDNILNKKSGLLGVSEISSDMRTLHEESLKGNPKAKLAMKMFSYRIKKYIGAYFAVLNRVDGIIFTGGIGENAYYIREQILENLSSFNISIDTEKNKTNSLIISKPNTTPVLVIPTNEELFIAKSTIAAIVDNNSNK
ncbi:MAG: acetate/propionate family kinase [Nitrospiraceae bacterium]|nr:acetate/propionate family kinase [Nitrospiraceae bacterium]